MYVNQSSILYVGQKIADIHLDICYFFIGQQVMVKGLRLAVALALCYNYRRGDIMKAVENLPEGYCEIYAIDLQKDKKTALVVNLLAIVIVALLAVPMHFAVPIFSLFSMENGLLNYMIRFGALLVLMC